MAQDGLLGKKLEISITDADGEVLETFPEILKWSVEEITEEDKKCLPIETRTLVKSRLLAA